VEGRSDRSKRYVREEDNTNEVLTLQEVARILKCRTNQTYELTLRLRLDKESRAALCQVSRGMKSGGFASRQVNGQWIWQRVAGKVEGQEKIGRIATSHVSEHSTHISVSE
jgi:hypothetical protein